MNFQSAADEANAALTHDLVSRLVPLEQDINRLEHYVALLEPRQTEVIRRTFFDSQSLPEICKEMGYSTKPFVLFGTMRLKNLLPCMSLPQE